MVFPRKRKGLLVVGVRHSTRDVSRKKIMRTLRGFLGKPNTQVSRLFTHLGEIRKERVGVEFKLSKKIRESSLDNPKNAYWYAVMLRAKRKRAVVQNLESKPLQKTLIALEIVLSDMAIRTRRYGMTLPIHVDFAAKGLSRESKNILRRLVAGIEKEFPDRNEKLLTRLSNSVSVYRSIMMFQEAKNAGLEKIAIGGIHAKDLELMGITHPKFTFGTPYLKGKSKQRINDYNSLRTFLHRVVKKVKDNKE